VFVLADRTTFPFAGAPTAVSSNPSRSGSVSFHSGCTTREVDSAMPIESSTATGRELATVTVTVAVSVCAPSLTVYVNESMPTNPGSGVYVTVEDAGANSVDPFVAGPAEVTDNPSRSGSESFPDGWTNTDCPSEVDTPSSTATGSVLLTVTVTVAVSVCAPSETVYVNESTPTNPGSGV
jgi:hypothetical protein